MCSVALFRKALSKARLQESLSLHAAAAGFRVGRGSRSLPRTAEAGCRAAVGRWAGRRSPGSGLRELRDRHPLPPPPPLTHDGSLVALRPAAAQRKGGGGGAAQQEEEEGGGREGRKPCEAPHGHVALGLSEPTAPLSPQPAAAPRPALPRRGARWEV